MYLADRLKRFRAAKQLSQGDIEKRSGLRRCYISRVENGITVPSIKNLQKISNALEIPMYQLFLVDDEPPLGLTPRTNVTRDWTTTRSGLKYMGRLTHALSQISDRNLEVLLATAGHMVRKNNRDGR